MRSENREGGWRAGETGGLVAVASLCASKSLTQRERERERQTYIVKPLCFSSWRQANSMTDTRWWPVSRGPLCLSHKARCSASVLLCHSFRTGWSHHIWPPRCLSLVPLPRPAGHSQVLFASGETERGRKEAHIQKNISSCASEEEKKIALTPPKSTIFRKSECHEFIMFKDCIVNLASHTRQWPLIFCTNREETRCILMRKKRNTDSCSLYHLLYLFSVDYQGVDSL